MGETTKRILSSIVLVVLFLVAFLYSGFYYLDLLVFGLIIIFFGLREFYDFSHREESQAFRGIGYFFSYIIFIVFYFQFMGMQKHIQPPEWVLHISKILLYICSATKSIKLKTLSIFNFKVCLAKSGY